jgi:hypothetical protein
MSCSATQLAFSLKRFEHFCLSQHASSHALLSQVPYLNVLGALFLSGIADFINNPRFLRHTYTALKSTPVFFHNVQIRLFVDSAL